MSLSLYLTSLALSNIILYMGGLGKLQLQAQIALVSEDLVHARLKMSGFTEFCLLEAPLDQLGSKQQIWTNSGPDVDGPSCHKTHLFLQSIFRGRTDIES